jgi:hypothetical protein
VEPKTISVDFDGVLHAYSQGYLDGSVYDAPVPGAIEALKFLMGKYCVFICTAREDLKPVISWLEGFGFKTDTDNGSPTWETQGVLLITNRKLPAAIYVDDRGLRFYSWQTAISQIEVLTC